MSDAEPAISLADWRTAPASRSAFHRVRELMPTAEIAAPASPSPLPDAAQPLADVEVALPGGRRLDLEAALTATFTDALVVLRRGEVVLERYAGGTTAATPHIVMSATKAVTGLVAAMLAAEGVLDEEAPIARYVPEISRGPYG